MEEDGALGGAGNGLGLAVLHHAAVHCLFSGGGKLTGGDGHNIIALQRNGFVIHDGHSRGGSGVELIVKTHEDYRGLLPGGGSIGGEGGGSGAGDEPQIIGHGDVAPVGGYIREGMGQVLGKARDLSVAQGTDQHNGHFLPGDGVHGTEGFTLGGDGAMDISGGDSPGIPLTLWHIPIRRGRGCGGVPAEEAAEGCCEGGPGYGLFQSEGIGSLSLEEAQLRAAADLRGGPVGGGHVGEGGGRNAERAHQHQGRYQTEDTVFCHKKFLQREKYRKYNTIISPQSQIYAFLPACGEEVERRRESERPKGHSLASIPPYSEIKIVPEILRLTLAEVSVVFLKFM